MNGLVDLHCHVLPGIDDGAQTIQCATELIEASVQKGVTKFVFTPHYYPERISLYDFIENRNHAVEKICMIAKRKGIQFRVGAEIQFTPNLASLPLERLAFSGTKYLLLEMLPLYEPHDVTGLIHRIRTVGYIPILAHVERFSYIEQNPMLLYQWVRAGALTQINAGWILKNRQAKKRFAQYYRWNLVHVIASDMHSLIHRSQNLVDAYQMLTPEMSAEFQFNAETIFEGNIVNIKPPKKPRRCLGYWK